MIAGAVVLVVVAGGAFYGGMQYEKSVIAQTGTTNRGAFGGNRQAGIGTDQSGQRGTGQNGGVRRGGGLVVGEILSKDDQSLTIKTPDGGSTIVYFTDALNVRKTETGSMEDLMIGAQVMVSGKANSDESVAADTVSITPVPAT